jgi:protein disulfide-isomerase A6
MRLTTLLWQLASATLAAAVLELTPENFDKEVLQSGRPSLIKFYAPWCGRESIRVFAPTVTDW